MNALVNIETITPEKLFVPGEVEKLIAKLEADVRAMPKPDHTTESGRDEIKSLAYKIARSKTGLDNLGKDFVAVLKKQSGLIDADRRIIRDRLESLQDEVRKPVTEWENSEKARVEAHEAALAQIRTAAELDLEPSSLTIEARLRLLGQIAQRDWQEFAPQANGALAISEDKLRAALAAAQKREADAAELKRLQAAELARQEAEAKAKRDADAAAAQAEAEKRRAEQERLRVEQAERDKAAAVEAAIEAERKRQEQEAAAAAAKKAAEDAAERKRQENKRHRAKVQREVIEALAPHTGDAESLFTAIAAGHIPHLTINY